MVPAAATKRGKSFCCLREVGRVHSQVPGVFGWRESFSRCGSVTGYFRRGAARGTNQNGIEQSSRIRSAANSLDHRGIRPFLRGGHGRGFKNFFGARLLRRGGDHLDHGAEHAGRDGGAQYAQRGIALAARIAGERLRNRGGENWHAGESR